MIRLPEGISRDDIGQWLYGGVCLYCPTPDTRVPAVMDRVYPTERGNLEAEVRLVTDGFGATLPVDPSLLAAHWPMCGSINVPTHKCAIHVERIPARQYKRTFCSRQVAFRVPRSWDLSKRLGPSTVGRLKQATSATVGPLFDPVYPSGLEEALGMLGNGWLSVALNPRVILAGDDLGKRMVYYRGELAATLVGEVLSPVADLSTCRIINRILKERYIWTVAL